MPRKAHIPAEVGRALARIGYRQRTWYSAAMSEKLRYGNIFQPLIRWVAEFWEDGRQQSTYRIKKAQAPIPD